MVGCPENFCIQCRENLSYGVQSISVYSVHRFLVFRKNVVEVKKGRQRVLFKQEKIKGEKIRKEKKISERK